jgi:phosphatidylglycerol:prolipoprotein diacylglycerol transferase
MRPVLFHVGAYPVFSYGVFVLVGMVMLFVMAWLLAREDGRKPENIYPIALGVLVGGFMGARLSHILVEPDKVIELLDFYSLFKPGTAGNILGLMLGGYVGGYAMQISLGLRAIGNYFAPALALASVIWRVGCTLAGCCYGTETDLPWGFTVAGEDHHPTMIYELIFNIILLAVTWRYKNRPEHDTALLYVYFASYTFFRFWLEYIRLYDKVLLGLTGIQVLCVVVWVWLAIWWWQQRRPFRWQRHAAI